MIGSYRSKFDELVELRNKNTKTEVYIDIDINNDDLNRFLLDDIEYCKNQLDALELKLKDILDVQNKSIKESAFDLFGSDKQSLEIVAKRTNDIKIIINNCYQLIKTMKTQEYYNKIIGNSYKLILDNALLFLLDKIYDFNDRFRKNQNNYNTSITNITVHDDNIHNNDENTQDADIKTKLIDNRKFDDEIEISENIIRERNKGIQKIEKGVIDLATLMNDFNILVVEQGSIINNIEFNVENAKVHVENGYKEIVKANNHSKLGRKYLCCIWILIILIIICSLLLIIKES